MSLGEICGGIMERRRGLICSWCSYSETPSGRVHFFSHAQVLTGGHRHSLAGCPLKLGFGIRLSKVSLEHLARLLWRVCYGNDGLRKAAE